MAFNVPITAPPNVGRLPNGSNFPKNELFTETCRFIVENDKLHLEYVLGRPSIREERREEILAAFERCIARKGLTKTTLADVADEAGQPRPLVRHFIGNRADMVGALIDRLLERSKSQLSSLPAGLGKEQTVELVLEAAFSDNTTNFLIMELWYLALRDMPLRKRLAEIYEGLILEVAALSGDAGLKNGMSREQAFAAVSMAFGAAFFQHLGIHPLRAQTVHNTVARILEDNRSVSKRPGDQ
jgi:AcrR family transcriptional regulator